MIRQKKINTIKHHEGRLRLVLPAERQMCTRSLPGRCGPWKRGGKVAPWEPGRNADLRAHPGLLNPNLHFHWISG